MQGWEYAGAQAEVDRLASLAEVPLSFAAREVSCGVPKAHADRVPPPATGTMLLQTVTVSCRAHLASSCVLLQGISLSGYHLKLVCWYTQGAEAVEGQCT